MGLLNGKSRLDRIAALPPAPYDQGPTLSGHTQVKTVPADQLDAVCRAVLSNMPGVTIAAKGRTYHECYDPWNDVGYIPDYPSAAERERLTRHMLGHARGGTHAEGVGEGAWWDAPWKSWWKSAPAKSGLLTPDMVQALIGN